MADNIAPIEAVDEAQPGGAEQSAPVTPEAPVAEGDSEDDELELAWDTDEESAEADTDAPLPEPEPGPEEPEPEPASEQPQEDEPAEPEPVKASDPTAAKAPEPAPELPSPTAPAAPPRLTSEQVRERLQAMMEILPENGVINIAGLEVDMESSKAAVPELLIGAVLADELAQRRTAEAIQTYDQQRKTEIAQDQGRHELAKVVEAQTGRTDVIATVDGADFAQWRRTDATPLQNTIIDTATAKDIDQLDAVLAAFERHAGIEAPQKPGAKGKEPAPVIAETPAKKAADAKHEQTVALHQDTLRGATPGVSSPDRVKSLDEAWDEDDD